MITNPLLRQSVEQLPQEVVLNTDWAFAISDRIAAIMERRGITPSEMAAAMGRTEEEVALWLGGTQNFTLKNIAAISAYLGEPLITVG